MTPHTTTSGTALVTGATGYIGARLVPALLAAGRDVRVLSRNAAKLEGRPWRDDVEIIEGDATEPDDLRTALDGVAVAYYLLHSMDGADDFGERDRQMAQSFADIAGEQGVGRVIYLGGLHPDDVELSDHLASRKEVGDILLAGGAPAAVLQAAVIVGSGSASFEMLRHLTERLPAMVAPKWLRNRIQPIAIRDALHLLVGAADLPADVNRTFDIGGPDVLTYREMIQDFARMVGLRKRIIVTLPVLTPRLAGHWVQFVTPMPDGLAKPLVQSLVHEVVCSENDIAEYVEDPAGGRLDFAASVELALALAQDFPRLSNAAEHDDRPGDDGPPSDTVTGDPEWAGEPVYHDERASSVDASPERVWDVVAGVGGEQGWYSPEILWRARGLVDSVAGGPGFRKDRPDRPLANGDKVDAWTVVDVDAEHRLLLRADTKLPGQAWLELIVDADGDGTRLTQRALFHPHGLAGHVYWNGMLLGHQAVFGSMHRNMVGAAHAARRSRITDHG